MNIYNSSVRRGGKSVGVIALVFSISGAPLLVQAANGDNMWTVTTAEASIGYELKDLAFSVASSDRLYAIGSKEETAGGPKDIFMERRQTSDGTLSTVFGGTGYASFGTTGENNILHAAVSTKSPSETQVVYTVSYNEALGKSEITMIDQSTGAQGNKYVSSAGVRYYAAASAYDARDDWTILYVAGTDASGNWIIQALKWHLGGEWWTTQWSAPIPGRPYAIAQDDANIYVGGYSVSGTNEQWHVEKIEKDTGTRIWPGGVDVDFSNVAGAGVVDDAVVALAINEEGIFAAGYDSGWGGVARWSVRRFNENGASTWSKNGSAVMPLGEIRSITVDPQDIYIAGRDAGSDEWRIEKRDGATGDIDTTDGFGGGDGILTENKGSNEAITALAHDRTRMFIGGIEGSGRTTWVVESRAVTEAPISCAFTTQASPDLIRTVQDISGNGYVCSDATCANAVGPVGLPGGIFPKGKYQFVVRSYDNHYAATAKPETKEQWALSVVDVNGTVKQFSRTTNDLTDYRAYREDGIEVDGWRSDAAFSEITMSHAFTGTTNGNGIVPACIAIDRYPQCGDGIDNDDGGSGPKDSDDDSCHVDGDASDGDNTYDSSIDDEGRILPACSDGQENDVPSDGKVDYGADVGCTDYFDTSEVNPECSDGVDNGDAEDTLVDAADRGCHVGNDLSKPYNPFDYNETDSVSSGALQCGDGIDNDDDGLTDAADIGCSDINDVSEFNILRFREN